MRVYLLSECEWVECGVDDVEQTSNAKTNTIAMGRKVTISTR